MWRNRIPAYAVSSAWNALLCYHSFSTCPKSQTHRSSHTQFLLFPPAHISCSFLNCLLSPQGPGIIAHLTLSVLPRLRKPEYSCYCLYLCLSPHFPLNLIFICAQLPTSCETKHWNNEQMLFQTSQRCKPATRKSGRKTTSCL